MFRFFVVIPTVRTRRGICFNFSYGEQKANLLDSPNHGRIAKENPRPLRRFHRCSRVLLGFNLARSLRSRNLGLQRLLLFGEACGLRAPRKLKICSRLLSRALTRPLQSIFGLRRLLLLSAGFNLRKPRSRK